MVGLSSSMRSSPLSKPNPKYSSEDCKRAKYHGQVRSFVRTCKWGFESADMVKPARVPQWDNIYGIQGEQRWMKHTPKKEEEATKKRDDWQLKRDKRRMAIRRRAGVQLKRKFQNGQLMYQL